MNYYRVLTLEGAILGVASSRDFRKIKNNKVLCTNEAQGQYVMVHNQLYRPIALANNLEPELYKDKYLKVKIIKIEKEEFIEYRSAEAASMRAKMAESMNENLE